MAQVADAGHFGRSQREIRSPAERTIRDAWLPALVSEHIQVAIDASAEIVAFADGSPKRLRQNGRLAKPMGLEFSVKNGDHVPWESRNEQHALWHAELNSGVISYHAQPHTLHLTVDGRRSSYTPDLLLRGADGSIDIVEVKDTFEEKKEPNYTAKLAGAAAVYRALGWSYMIVTKTQLEAEPGFADIELLHRYRKTATQVEAVQAVQDLLSGGPVAVNAVRAILPPDPIGMAQLSAMIVHRVIGVDLTYGLAGDAVVALPDAWSWPKPFGCSAH